MSKRTHWALLLAAALLVGGLSGCTQPEAEHTPSPAPVESPAPSSAQPSAPTETDGTGETVRLAVLKGPSGVGAVQLLAESEAGRTQNQYEVSLLTDNSEAAAGLTNGSIDIAAMASNVALNLYHKSGGDIQIAAVSGLGVLYILENGESVTSMADLEGRTLYAAGQGANPEYVLNYLLRENGVDPAGVDIQWKSADEIATLMATGEAGLCMLPVPAATGVMAKNAGVREALDLSAEWDRLNNGSRLTMTVLAVRTEFAREHPEAVDAFLEEYRASVEAVSGDPAGYAELVAQYGITPSAQIAEAAIPKCALVCITGAREMRNAIQGYFEVLFQADPASIGGSIPDDGFYYEGGA